MPSVGDVFEIFGEAHEVGEGRGLFDGLKLVSTHGGPKADIVVAWD